MLASMIDQLEHSSLSKDLAKYINNKRPTAELIEEWG